MGDASVPTPLRPSPAPTDVTICPKKPTVESPPGVTLVASPYVTLSAAKGLSRSAERCFATLSMTGRRSAGQDGASRTSGA